MCGIAGGPEGSRTRKALDAIAHRGPDAAGVHVASGYEQGHVRLSIIDVSASSDQPFKYSDGVLCFNGEIWNFKALREELVGLGHEFRTSGDTEVLAAALAEWGPKAALSKVEGMFAFSWHHPRDGLCLARDRFGEIPLHVASRDGRIYWGSEVRALKAMGVPAKAVMWMPPGTILHSVNGKHQFERWYRAPVPGHDWTTESAAAAYACELRKGARARSMSDVPVCALLSGGIDSAAIVFELAQVIPDLVCYVAAPAVGESRDVRCARDVARMTPA